MRLSLWSKSSLRQAARVVEGDRVRAVAAPGKKRGKASAPQSVLDAGGISGSRKPLFRTLFVLRSFSSGSDLSIS